MAESGSNPSHGPMTAWLALNAAIWGERFRADLFSGVQCPFSDNLVSWLGSWNTKLVMRLLLVFGAWQAEKSAAANLGSTVRLPTGDSAW